jgi:hypothetical protein
MRLYIAILVFCQVWYTIGNHMVTESGICGGAIDVDEATCEPLIKLRPGHDVPISVPLSASPSSSSTTPTTTSSEPSTTDEPAMPALPSGVTATRISRISVAGGGLFANVVAKLDQPIILSDANNWEARRKWSPNFPFPHFTSLFMITC